MTHKWGAKKPDQDATNQTSFGYLGLHFGQTLHFCQLSSQQRKALLAYIHVVWILSLPLEDILGFWCMMHPKWLRLIPTISENNGPTIFMQKESHRARGWTKSGTNFERKFGWETSASYKYITYIYTQYANNIYMCIYICSICIYIYINYIYRNLWYGLPYPSRPMFWFLVSRSPGQATPKPTFFIK